MTDDAREHAASDAGAPAAGRQPRHPLLTQLAGALSSGDPVPEQVLAAARGSLAWRTIDRDLAELAELVDDSAETPLAGVRAAAVGNRMLTFEAGETAVVLEVSDANDGRVLLGQLVGVPEGAVRTVDLRHAGGTEALPADAHGRFRSGGLPRGPVSLAFELPEDGGRRRRVVTSWVSV